MALAGQHAIFERLARRNRLVSRLRLAVPVAGGLVLIALSLQIWLASSGARFSVGQISVATDAVTIDAPEYVGVLEDGSSYRVWAISARAPLERSDLVDLSEAQLVLNRIDGVQLSANASQAKLDTNNQLTLVPGLADIADSQGSVGTLVNSVFDWNAQTLTANGPVAIEYADGSSVRAEGLVYDAAAIVWTFSRSVVTLPSTPGEQAP